MKSNEEFLRKVCDELRAMKQDDVADYMPKRTGATIADFANALEEAADEIADLRKQLKEKQ